MDEETPDNIAELIHADRDLTPAEEETLRRYTEDSWASISRALALRARAVYSVAKIEDFRRCVREHMDLDDWSEMAHAELYHCPSCGLLLKDRGTPVAAAALLERQRIRRLWQAVQDADEGPDKTEAQRRFIAGLGRES